MIRFLSALLLIVSCSHKSSTQQHEKTSGLAVQTEKLTLGADQLDKIIAAVKDKNIALVVNHTARVGKTHLLDTLLSHRLHVKKIMAPEHGFRGKADAGESVKDGIDTKTGLPIISLYGSNKKPTSEQLTDVDVIIFDIQDVGVRFFTYISTLHYVMEACAENNKQLIVLDRPNPNGSYVDGPVLQAEHKSFVGMHPVPIVHGLTIGEYALMINGEKWIDKACNLSIIAMKNWKHTDTYDLPERPSPNLPSAQAVKLYPSTCLFEGTVISVGRGTYTPFEVIGHPDLKKLTYSFTPISIDGMAKKPPFENQVCYGLDLSKAQVKNQLDLSYLIDIYQQYPDKEKFFIPYFEKLVGTSELREQIKLGLTEDEIRKSWQKELDLFKEKRKKYLLYP